MELGRIGKVEAGSKSFAGRACQVLHTSRCQLRQKGRLHFVEEGVKINDINYIITLITYYIN